MSETPDSPSSWASTPAIRRTMRSNLRTDTRPELRLRSELHRLGLRFRKDHPVPLPDHRVRPDIVFPRARVAVFVDGCFWHSCPEHATRPKANAAFWTQKLEANVARDRRTDDALTNAGWEVVRIWEHERPVEAAARIRDIVVGTRETHTEPP